MIQQFKYLITVAMLIFSISVSASTSGHILFRHQMGDNPPSGIDLPESSSSRAPGITDAKHGHINLDFTNVPDTIQVCVRLACNYWEELIPNKVPINLHVEVTEDFVDEVLVCDVDFVYAQNQHLIPSALYIQQNPNTQVDNLTHAYIWLNKNKIWNCNLSRDKVIESHNVYTYIIRAIPLCLGFGTSVTSFDGEHIQFNTPGYTSLFDDMIFNSHGEYLKDCSETELANYVCPPAETDIYVGNNDQNHLLYAPAHYRLGESLVYLDNPNSLMHYEFGKGDQRFRVDDLTVDLLNQIGWNITDKSSSIEIASSPWNNMISVKKIPSIYSSYMMCAKNKNKEQITRYNWELYLFDKSGSPIKVAESTNSTFEVGPISNPEHYRTYSNGEIIGEIRLTAQLDEEVVEAVPYAIFFSQKPFFKNIKIDRIEHPESRSYDESYTIEYYGADNFTAMFEEQTACTHIIHDVYEPHIAHLTVTGFSMDDILERTFIATNEYGTTISTSSFNYQYPDPYKPVKPDLTETIPVEDLVEVTQIIRIYDFRGNLVKECSPNISYSDDLPSGIYYVHFHLKDGTVTIKKIII